MGVTQADVGKALATLQLPGVGSLSQSTICRFESLTLSHNNMIALRPILQAWLETAENQSRQNRTAPPTTANILQANTTPAQMIISTNNVASGQQSHIQPLYTSQAQDTMVASARTIEPHQPNQNHSSPLADAPKAVESRIYHNEQLLSDQLDYNKGACLQQTFINSISPPTTENQISEFQPVFNESLYTSIDQIHGHSLQEGANLNRDDTEEDESFDDNSMDNYVSDYDDEADEDEDEDADEEASNGITVRKNNINNGGGGTKKIYNRTEDKSNSKRTSIALRERKLLEEEFLKLSRPTSEQLKQISKKLNMDKNTVRVWFCNQRQKQKRLKYTTNNLSTTSTSSPDDNNATINSRDIVNLDELKTGTMTQSKHP